MANWYAVPTHECGERIEQRQGIHKERTVGVILMIPITHQHAGCGFDDVVLVDGIEGQSLRAEGMAPQDTEDDDGEYPGQQSCALPSRSADHRRDQYLLEPARVERADS